MRRMRPSCSPPAMPCALAGLTGRASGVEIRVPYVDVRLPKAVVPLVPGLAPGAGKTARAAMPTVPLPDEIVTRAKTGFGAPTGAWRERAAGRSIASSGRRLVGQGLISREWSRRVVRSFAWEKPTGSYREGKGSVLIFRIGSLGDTVVALPCFHRIARSFPDARRVLLTNIPTSPKAATVESVIGNSGLVHEVIHFPAPPRRPRELLSLGAQIRRTQAKTLVYVADRKLFPTLRDVLYFRACGIRKVIGAPLSRDLRRLRIDPETANCEREAERLARCLAPLGPIDLHDPRAWDLHLLAEEQGAADTALATLSGRDFIAVSIGTKWPVNDWGDTNWAALIRSLSAEWADQALVFFGAGDEFDRSAGLAVEWRGPTLNLCGQLLPRASGAALRKALVFLGHDSGPMHLASAVGVPCIAIFGNHYPPKRWHPIGEYHRLIHNMRGVAAIPVAEVREAASQAICGALARRGELPVTAHIATDAAIQSA
jgi:lipopolysaccharide heptosyltransferase III